jgi:hypothetical protein
LFDNVQITALLSSTIAGTSTTAAHHFNRRCADAPDAGRVCGDQSLLAMTAASQPTGPKS